MKIPIFLFVGVLSALTVIYAKENRSGDPKSMVKYPKRHLTVQLGITGRKPWHHLASYHTKTHFRSAVFEPLFHITRYYEIKTGLVKDWFWDEKTNSYLFTIDTSAAFSKKRTLKVEDIEFALVKNFLSKYPNSDRRLYMEIVGVEELKIGTPFKSGLCPGIVKVSESQFRIHIKKQNPLFIYTLAAMSTPIAPVEDFKEDMFSFKGVPRGTGDYRVTWSDEKSSRVLLERKLVNQNIIKNSKYPLSMEIVDEGKPVDNKVDLAAGAGTNGLKKDQGYKFLTNTVPTIVQVIDFNFGNALGKNILFRKAVSLALNRNEIFEGYRNTNECHELVPEGYYGRSNKKFKYDPKEASEIVKKYFTNTFSEAHPLIGFFHGKKGAKKLPKYVEKIKKQLKSVGIYIDFVGSEIVPFKELPKNYVMGTFGHVTSFTDPLAPFTMYLVEGSDLVGNADASDKIARELHRLASEANSKEKRAEYITKLSAHFQKNFISLPIEHRGAFFAYNEKTVKTLENQDGIFAIDYDKIEVLK